MASASFAPAYALMTGLITPHRNLLLFVADSAAKAGLAALTRQSVPLFLAEQPVLIFITFCPLILIGLPRRFSL